MFEVSIVIINYFSSKLIKNCINSIIKFTKKITYEIIIVDNSNNNDELKKIEEIIKSKNTSGKVISPKNNLGTSKANNLASKLCKGDYLLFLNPDTLLLNNAIYEMYEVIKNDTRIGAVGCNLYDKNLKESFSYLKNNKDEKNDVLIKPRYIRKILEKTIIPKSNLTFNHTDKNLAINGFICGACLMINRTFFLEIGGYDESFYMYDDDCYLCYKIKNVFDKKMVITPKGKIMHLEKGTSENTLDSFKKRMELNVDGDILFLKKTCGDKRQRIWLKKYIKITRKKLLIVKFSKNKDLEQKTKILLDILINRFSV